MTQQLFNQNFDYCKSYKTLEGLHKVLSKYEGWERAIPVIIPYGKNQGRHTAIFPAQGGENMHWVHRGFTILG